MIIFTVVRSQPSEMFIQWVVPHFFKFNNKSFPLRLALRGHDWGVGGAGGFGSSLAGGETSVSKISTNQ